jgi:peptidoglycan/LPS O-acetylase OafA/YrhL
VVAVLVFHVAGYLMTPEKNPAAQAVAGSWIGGVSKAGHSGVELFFVISGIVLGLPFARAAAGLTPPVQMRRYYLRRLTRLEPPYIINLLLLTGLLIALGKTTWTAIAPHLGASLAYCHNMVYGRGSDVNFVAWTLEIEVQFYLLAPLLAGLFWIRDARVRRLALAGSVVGASLVTVLLAANPATPRVVHLSLLFFLQYFLAGFALADWYARGGDRGPRTDAADLLALPCVAAAVSLDAVPTVRTLLLPLAFAGLCYSALQGRRHARLTATPFMVLIGGMCYTIYLYHPFIKAFFGPWIVRATPAALPGWVAVPLQLTAFGVVIIAVCIPLFLCFEKPFMALGVRRQKSPATP